MDDERARMVRARARLIPDLDDRADDRVANHGSEPFAPRESRARLVER
jgi:hypothetical protein